VETTRTYGELLNISKRSTSKSRRSTGSEASTTSMRQCTRCELQSRAICGPGSRYSTLTTPCMARLCYHSRLTMTDFRASSLRLSGTTLPRRRWEGWEDGRMGSARNHMVRQMSAHGLIILRAFRKAALDRKSVQTQFGRSQGTCRTANLISVLLAASHLRANVV
jgi:hypothetical protein